MLDQQGFMEQKIEIVLRFFFISPNKYNTWGMISMQRGNIGENQQRHYQ